MKLVRVFSLSKAMRILLLVALEVTLARLDCSETDQELQALLIVANQKTDGA